MHFMVEHKTAYGWQTVDAKIRSEGPYAAQMAVSRAAKGFGLHRARRLDDPDAKAELFDVLSWGLPVPVEA